VLQVAVPEQPGVFPQVLTGGVVLHVAPQLLVAAFKVPQEFVDTQFLF